MGKTKYMTTPDLLANAELPSVDNGHVHTAALEIVMNTGGGVRLGSPVVRNLLSENLAPVPGQIIGMGPVVRILGYVDRASRGRHDPAIAPGIFNA